jgi:hypothetical protein
LRALWCNCIVVILDRIRGLVSRRRPERSAESDEYRGDMTGPARSGRRVEPVRHPHNLDEYEGCWVAVKNGEVVAVAKTSRELVYAVHQRGDQAKGAVAQFVPPVSGAAMVGVG